MGRKTAAKIHHQLIVVANLTQMRILRLPVILTLKMMILNLKSLKKAIKMCFKSSKMRKKELRGDLGARDVLN